MNLFRNCFIALILFSGALLHLEGTPITNEKTALNTYLVTALRTMPKTMLQEERKAAANRRKEEKKAKRAVSHNQIKAGLKPHVPK